MRRDTCVRIAHGHNNDAAIIGMQDSIGTVEKGKFADIIAVSGDPLVDITEMQQVKFVMKGGAVIRNDPAPHGSSR